MTPIRSFWEICFAYGLLPSQAVKLRALVERRKGTLHPYWVQLALYMPSSSASRLHNELVANEWVVPDKVELGGQSYETALSADEISLIALIELAEEAI